MLFALPARPFEHIAFTLPANMSEQPALSINAGFTAAGLPIGLQILERAAKVVPGQRHLKRVIAEMGGKNAMIVMDDADLDLALDHLVAVAGQAPAVQRKLELDGQVHVLQPDVPPGLDPPRREGAGRRRGCR